MLQKFFERERKARNQNLNAQVCSICFWKSGSRSHKSRCQRYSHLLPDKNTTTCPACKRSFPNRGGLYCHFDSSACKPIGTASTSASASINASTSANASNSASTSASTNTSASTSTIANVSTSPSASSSTSASFEEEAQVDKEDEHPSENVVTSVVKIENANDDDDENEIQITGVVGNANQNQDDARMDLDANQPVPNDMKFLLEIKFLHIADFSVYFKFKKTEMCFNVHKLKLADCSSVLEKVVTENVDWRVPNFENELTLEVLRFVYCKDYIPQKPMQAIKAALKFEIPKLLEICEKFDLTDDNVACLLYQNNFHGISANLKCKAEEYILKNMKTVVHCGRWYALAMNPVLVYKLFESKKCTNCNP